MTIAGVLLAAGSSRRFGSDDKLLALLHGRPLVSYAADALRAAGPDHLIGVTGHASVAAHLKGYDLVTPTVPDPQQSDSLRAGVSRAKHLGVSKLVVVLGDMPFVTTAMVMAVTEACTDTKPSACTDGTRPFPPACFPAGRFDALMALSGDRGAAALLYDAVLLAMPQTALFDVDTPDALALAARMLEERILH